MIDTLPLPVPFCSLCAGSVSKLDERLEESRIILAPGFDPFHISIRLKYLFEGLGFQSRQFGVRQISSKGLAFRVWRGGVSGLRFGFWT